MALIPANLAFDGRLSSAPPPGLRRLARGPSGVQRTLSAGVALLFGACVTACGAGAPPPSAQSPALGNAVQLSLPTDEGNLATVPTSGQAVVLDFWAPSCKPCAKSLPELVAREGDLRARGTELVLVAVLADGETTELARQTLSGWGVERPFLVDRGEVSRREAAVTDLPATLLIGGSGTLRWVAPAEATADDVVAAAAAR